MYLICSNYHPQNFCINGCFLFTLKVFLQQLHSKALRLPFASKGSVAVHSRCRVLTAQLYCVVWGSLRRGLTSRCSSVKITGSATNTRLDSLVIEADRMWELTVRERLRLLRSPIPLSVAFSVLRNWPRCL